MNLYSRTVAGAGGPGRGPVCPAGLFSLRLGSLRERDLLELVLPPWPPAAPGYSRHKTWELLNGKNGVNESHNLSSSLREDLINSEFHCAWVLIEFHTSIVGTLASLGIKLWHLEPFSLSSGRSLWA